MNDIGTLRNRVVTFAAVVLVAVIALGAWLNRSFSLKQKYDELRTELASHLLVENPLDAEIGELLANVEENWTVHHDVVGGPHSELISTLGLDPTVANLVHVFTFQLPTYSLTASSRNKEALAMGAMQNLMLLVSVDGLVHVSADKQLAMVRCGPDTVYIFRNDQGALRESLYQKQQERDSGQASGEQDA